MTFWFLVMYPHPPQNQNKIFYPKLDLSWPMYPPPRIFFLSKVRFELADVPPHPRIEKYLTSDHELSDPSDESQLKCEKGLLSH